MTSESQAWSSVREALISEATAIKHAIHIVRVENMVAVGTLDANICMFGKEFWMEGKHIEYLPVKPTTKIKVGLRPDQAVFATRRLLCGSPCWLWCRVSRGRPGSDGSIGWYLFRLDSQDIIDKLQLGMSLTEFMTHKRSSSKLMARELFHVEFPGLSYV